MARIIGSTQNNGPKPSKLSTLASAVRTEALSTARETKSEAQRLKTEALDSRGNNKKGKKSWFAKKEVKVSGKIEESSQNPYEPKSIGLTLTRIEPIDAAKVSFFTSLAISIALTITITLFWLLLDTTGIIFQFTQVIIGSGIGVDISGAFSTGKVFLIMVILSCLNVALWTAMGAVMASIYNVAAQLTGGYKLRFTHR